MTNLSRERIVEWTIAQDDVQKWLQANRDIEKFHAVFTDPPYHLATITKRFGKKESAPAKFGNDGAFSRVSRGFMGEAWDTDIAFSIDFWSALGEIMHYGAFGLAFMSTRTYHRAATAIEDAGFIIHPMMAWIQSQGFPKPTRVDTQIDSIVGKERKVIGKVENPGSTNPRLSMHDGWQDSPDITEPATKMAKIWEGHRYGLQALKPCFEPLVLFQKPFQNKPVDDIMETGAGTLNIYETKFASGREFAINRFKDGMKPFGNGAGHEYATEIETNLYPTNIILSGDVDEPFTNYFYHAKASPKEKNAGLASKNTHPTVKPLGLTEYLSKLLLPPQEYSPRRLFVPFAGTGSEMIGALLSGWDTVIGVELREEAVDVAKQRLEYHCKYERK